MIHHFWDNEIPNVKTDPNMTASMLPGLGSNISQPGISSRAFLDHWMQRRWLRWEGKQLHLGVLIGRGVVIPSIFYVVPTISKQSFQRCCFLFSDFEWEDVNQWWQADETKNPNETKGLKLKCKAICYKPVS